MDVQGLLRSFLSDRYRIDREIGAGGMATVYLAEDLRHQRLVAVKALRPELGALLGPERFLTEINVMASLQHPHLLPLFDSGEADGLLYYVMPYVEGESLRRRLERERQLPVDEAVRMATSVASALDYAHRHGVIHRDLKPENILLHEGQPLVADFGIALAVSNAGGERITQTGLSLGTPQYMSPEQMTGDQVIDARSDLYSLAAMLYEMLVGDPPHTAATTQALIARVLTEPPPRARAYRPAVPEHVDAALLVALAKLPADRFASAERFGEALTGVRPPHPSAPRPWTGARTVPFRPVRAWVGVAAFAVTGAGAALAVSLLVRSPEPPALYDVGLPYEAPLHMYRVRTLSVSPAADFVVYVAQREGDTELWYRSLRGDTARAIPRTESAWAPAISPDGESLAFIAKNELRVMSLPNGEQRVLGTLIGTAEPPVWGSDAEILLVNGGVTILRSFDPEVGETRREEGLCGLLGPLDDSGRFLCSRRYAAGIFDVDAQTVEPVRHSRSGASDHGNTLLRGAQFTPVDGRYVVYMSIDGDLRATTLDAENGTVGRSVTLLSGVRREALKGAGQFAIARNGSLVIAQGDNAERGTIVRSAGREPVTLPFPSAAYLRYDLTRDGNRLAAVVQGPQDQELRVSNASTGQTAAWLGSFEISEPLWDPEGTKLLATVLAPLPDGGDATATVWGSPDSTVPPDTVLTGLNFRPSSWLPDGRVLGAAGGALVTLDLSDRPARVDTLLMDVFFNQLSPDGRWLVHQPPDQRHVVLQPFPRLDRQFQVTQGGDDPQWLSSAEIVYLGATSPDDRPGAGRTFFRARVDPDSEPPVGAPAAWFFDPSFSQTPGRSFTPTPDGGVVYVRSPAQTAPYLRVIPGWVEEMKRAVDEANAGTGG